ncbi:MAG: hypothetical protein IKN62_05675 [Elusimicrobia bacterium]|nr:hypothetical protein [Elusimicrobiota bacterium]
MEKKARNIIFNVGLLHKFFSCVIAFFMLISSVCVIEIKTDFSLIETAKISADTLLVQFFYISTLPMNVISKMFVNTEAETPIAPVKSQDKNNAAKDSNSAKASFGYSILPNVISLSQVVKTAKAINTSMLVGKIKKSRDFCYFRNYEFVCIENALLFGFMMMLLLAILLTRRNVGNDNIILTIKNNNLARLM